MYADALRLRSEDPTAVSRMSMFEPRGKLVYLKRESPSSFHRTIETLADPLQPLGGDPAAISGKSIFEPRGKLSYFNREFSSSPKRTL